MASYNIGLHEYDTDQCRDMLCNLPGIFAAGLRFEENQLVEIHVLASADRNPKQIARDIQSALFASYGIEVDHRIISIAQLPQDPFVHPAETAPAADNASRDVRLLFTGVDSSQKNGSYTVNVHILCEGKDIIGEGRCRNTIVHRHRTVANATLNAVNALLGGEYYTLMDVKETTIWDMTIAVTVIEYQETPHATPTILVGAAAISNDPDAGIVRSTLDGINRSFSKLYPQLF